MDMLNETPAAGSLLGLILIALILYRRPIIESLRSMGHDHVADEMAKTRAEIAGIKTCLEDIRDALRSMRDEMLRCGGRDGRD